MLFQTDLIYTHNQVFNWKIHYFVTLSLRFTLRWIDICKIRRYIWHSTLTYFSQINNDCLLHNLNICQFITQFSFLLLLRLFFLFILRLFLNSNFNIWSWFFHFLNFLIFFFLHLKFLLFRKWELIRLWIVRKDFRFNPCLIHVYVFYPTFECFFLSESFHKLSIICLILTLWQKALCVNYFLDPSILLTSTTFSNRFS